MSFLENITYYSSAEDLKFSKVTEFRYDYEHETTHSSTNPEDTAVSSSENNQSFAGFLMIFGLGGVLTFFAIYSFLTYYYLHVKDRWDHSRREEEEEIERRRNLLRLMNPTLPSNTRSSPSFIFEDRRFFPEDFEDVLGGGGLPQLNPSPEASSEHTRVKLPFSSSTSDRSTQEEDNKRNLFRLGYQNPPSNTRLRPSFTSEETNERRFFPEDFEDILCGNSFPQVSPSLEALIEPTHIDLPLGTSTPEPVEVKDISHSDNKLDTSLPERKCRSSPSSCTITRRHLHRKVGTIRRPSSWN